MEQFLEKNINLKHFIKYVAPSVLMFLFISLYSIIDGFFVGKYVGTNALASINIVVPLTGVLSGIAVMISAGSCAFTMIKLGEKDYGDANKNFSLICILALPLGAVFFITSFLWLKNLLEIMGASKILFDNSYTYSLIFLAFYPCALLSIIFEYYIRIDGKPFVTLILYITGVMTNVISDYILVAECNLGVLGAALGTGFSFTASSLIGLFYFMFFSNRLKFVKTKWDFKFLFQSCFNGVSEMISECSASIVTLIANIIIIKIAGEDGVAAFSIVSYIHFLFTAVNFGYIAGVSPIISYCYGAKQFNSINKCYTYSKKFICITSIGIFILSQIAAPEFIMIFADDKTVVYNLASYGLRVTSISFLFSGLNIFASGMFTAYGNGKVSALISINNDLIAIIIAMFICSWIWGLKGVWIAMPLAELSTFILSIIIIRRYSKLYNYL